jgi:hypothetical protein
MHITITTRNGNRTVTEHMTDAEYADRQDRKDDALVRVVLVVAVVMAVVYAANLFVSLFKACFAFFV